VVLNIGEFKIKVQMSETKRNIVLSSINIIHYLVEDGVAEFR